MDALDSLGGLTASASTSALERLQQVSLDQKTTGITTEEIVSSSDARKMQLAKNFESLLLTKLFDQVKESIKESSFDDDPASGQVHGMFWSYLAQDISDKGGFGLWQDIYENFKDLEGQQTTGELMDKEL